MTLRKIPGALVLGLLASLAAHTALFGGQHSVAGAYHDAIVQLAEAGVCAFVALVAVLAWLASGHSTGSVVARRLRTRLPNGVTVLGSTGIWYAAIEAIEPHHAGVSGLVLLAVLALAAFVVLRLAHALTDALARAAVAISHAEFSPRLPVWRRRRQSVAVARSTAHAHRRFARPPPIVVAFSRA